MPIVDTREDERPPASEGKTPAIVWVLLVLGSAALVAGGLLQGQITVGGPLPSSARIALISIVGGLGGPLLIAGLVGLVLSKLGAFRR